MESLKKYFCCKLCLSNDLSRLRFLSCLHVICTQCLANYLRQLQLSSNQYFCGRQTFNQSNVQPHSGGLHQSNKGKKTNSRFSTVAQLFNSDMCYTAESRNISREDDDSYEIIESGVGGKSLNEKSRKTSCDSYAEYQVANKQTYYNNVIVQCCEPLSAMQDDDNIYEEVSRNSVKLSGLLESTESETFENVETLKSATESHEYEPKLVFHARGETLIHSKRNAMMIRNINKEANNQDHICWHRSPSDKKNPNKRTIFPFEVDSFECFPCPECHQMFAISYHGETIVDFSIFFSNTSSAAKQQSDRIEKIANSLLNNGDSSSLLKCVPLFCCCHADKVKYCARCGKSLCLNCSTTFHLDHFCENLDFLSVRHKDLVKSLVDVNGIKCRHLERKVEAFNSHVASINETKCKVIDSLSQQKKLLIEEIEKVFENKVNKLEKIVAAEILDVQESVGEIVEYMAKLNRCLGISEILLKHDGSVLDRSEIFTLIINQFSVLNQFIPAEGKGLLNISFSSGFIKLEEVSSLLGGINYKQSEFSCRDHNQNQIAKSFSFNEDNYFCDSQIAPIKTETSNSDKHLPKTDKPPNNCQSKLRNSELDVPVSDKTNDIKSILADKKSLSTDKQNKAHPACMDSKVEIKNTLASAEFISSSEKRSSFRPNDFSENKAIVDDDVNSERSGIVNPNISLNLQLTSDEEDCSIVDICTTPDNYIVALDAGNKRLKTLDLVNVALDVVNLQGVYRPFSISAFSMTNVDKNNDGSFVIADKEPRNCLRIINRLGHVVMTFGASYLLDISGIAINSHDQIFVADIIHRKSFVFDMQGNHLFSFPRGSKHGDNSSDFCPYPQAIKINPVTDDVFIYDSQSFSIFVFDRVGRHLFQILSEGSHGSLLQLNSTNFYSKETSPIQSINSSPETGSGHSGDLKLSGFVFDQDGHAYVSSVSGEVVFVYDTNGKCLTRLETRLYGFKSCILVAALLRNIHGTNVTALNKEAKKVISSDRSLVILFDSLTFGVCKIEPLSSCDSDFSGRPKPKPRLKKLLKMQSSLSSADTDPTSSYISMNIKTPLNSFIQLDEPTYSVINEQDMQRGGTVLPQKHKINKLRISERLKKKFFKKPKSNAAGGLLAVNPEKSATNPTGLKHS